MLAREKWICVGCVWLALATLLLAGCRTRQQGGYGEAVDQPAPGQVVIRGTFGSKLTTLLVFAGTGERDGQMYVWQNRNRATVASEMDGWYDSPRAFVDAMNARERISYELWAGDDADASQIGRSGRVPIRALRQTEIAQIVAGIKIDSAE